MLRRVQELPIGRRSSACAVGLGVFVRVFRSQDDLNIAAPLAAQQIGQHFRNVIRVKNAGRHENHLVLAYEPAGLSHTGNFPSCQPPHPVLK